MSTKLKEAFEVEKEYGAFYTGGTVAWTSDGEQILCQNNDHINLINVATNSIEYSIGTEIDNVTDATTTMGGDDIQDQQNIDIIYTFAISDNDEFIVSAHKSGLLKLWLRKSMEIINSINQLNLNGTTTDDETKSKPTGQLIKIWKSLHQGPITKLQFSKSNEIIASAGVDSKIRLWNFQQKICLATFPLNQGVINCLSFVPEFRMQFNHQQHHQKQQPQSNQMEKLIVASADDNKIMCWNYIEKKLKYTLNGHLSKVTSITYSFTDDDDDAGDGQSNSDKQTKYYLISASRDKVIIVWDLQDNGKQLYVIPVYECIESVIYLSSQLKLKLPNGKKLNQPNDLYVLTGGEFGIIKIWELKTGQIIYEQTNSLINRKTSEENMDTGGGGGDGTLLIHQCLYNIKLSQFAIITVDHNILLYNLNTFYCNKQLIGFTDDILDLVLFGKHGRYLALATNSNDIKIYDTLNMNCQLLRGHTDIVLTLAAYKNFLLSAGKDMKVLLWEIDPSNFTIICRASGKKHTAAIGSITFGKISSNICASVSQDTCLKIWKIPALKSTDTDDNKKLLTLNCMATQIAHEKDVNCVTISPNDKMLATGSQDKLAKIWNCSDLALLGVLRGHKRGIWSVRFSPIDQILLTTSADCTMKLWSIQDMSCLKSFDGQHTSSILRGEFINKGLQILSAGSDGLIKLWCIKTSECVATFDKHTDRIWSLAVSPDEQSFYSGGSDSMLLKWIDCTESQKLAKQLEENQIVLQEQQLQNLLKQNNYIQALSLAIHLQKPNLTLKIITTLIKENGVAGAGDDQCKNWVHLRETIMGLDDTEKESLLKHSVTWNTISKNTLPAQIVINLFLNEMLSGTFKPNGLIKIIEDLLPYTERHYRRMTQYLLDLKFLEFMQSSMQQHIK